MRSKDMGKGDNRKSTKETKKPKKEKLKTAVTTIAPRASAEVPVAKKK
jgi:hypothetical protein